MKMAMRIGDVVINPWISKTFEEGTLNPNYATIYIGNNKSIDYEGRVHKWGYKIYQTRKTDVFGKALPPEKQTPWRVIGHVDLKDVIMVHIQNDENKGVKNEG